MSRAKVGKPHRPFTATQRKELIARLGKHIGYRVTLQTIADAALCTKEYVAEVVGTISDMPHVHARDNALEKAIKDTWPLSSVAAIAQSHNVPYWIAQRVLEKRFPPEWRRKRRYSRKLYVALQKIVAFVKKHKCPPSNANLKRYKDTLRKTIERMPKDIWEIYNIPTSEAEQMSDLDKMERALGVKFDRFKME